MYSLALCSTLSQTGIQIKFNLSFLQKLKEKVVLQKTSSQNQKKQKWPFYLLFSAVLDLLREFHAMMGRERKQNRNTSPDQRPQSPFPTSLLTPVCLCYRITSLSPSSSLESLCDCSGDARQQRIAREWALKYVLLIDE